MSNDMIVLHPDAKGKFTLPIPRADIQRIDIADVDLVITTKSGAHYLLPGAGLAAMSDSPPDVAFTNGTLSTDQLLGEVGAVLDLASAIPAPSSLKLDGADSAVNGNGKDQNNQAQQAQNNHSSDSDSQVSSLTVNTEATVEQLVANAQKIDQDLHSHDFDYTPPQQFEPPPNALSPPPGVPPPISLTPLVTLFMGNVVGTTTSTTDNPGYTTYYGGGGAVGSDATAQLGPRDALQFSAATITGDNGNDIIYAEGPLVGNTNPASSNASYYTKQFILNVAGYFTQLNNITFSNVPANLTIVGATNEGNGVWVLPSSYVLKNQTFTIVYGTNVAPGTFDIDVNITGVVSRGAVFNSTQDFRFQYMDVTSTSQITDPTLVYDSGGLSKEIYVLPILDQPNIITAGNGNDIVYGSRSNDTITLGNGNNQVTDGNGTDVITIGTGNNTVTIGTGSDTVTTGGTGATTLTIAGGTLGTDTITFGTTTTDSGSNTIYVNSAAGSTGIYNITLYGSGTQTVTSQNGYAGDGNYTITLNGTGTLDVSIGAGTDTIATYGNSGTMTVGTNTDASAHTIYLNSTSGNTGLYTLTMNGTGAQTVAFQAGSSGDGDYNITMGGTGVHSINIGNSTSNGNGTTTFDTTIVTGAGTNTITTGNGIHEITVGAGAATINTGTGNDVITTAGGGGTVNAGAGNNSITVNSTAGSTDTYTLTTTGTGTNTITAGDDLYTVTLGAGTNSVTLGNGTNSFNTRITAGAGTNAITTGNGQHTISVGAGVATINTGSGNDAITTAGGGGTVNAGAGNNSITVNSTAGSTDSYTLTTSGTGTNTITAGDDLYTVTLGAGTNTITLGSGTDAFNTQITTGAGSNTIATGNGQHTISVGAGVATINTGSGNDAITTAGGGGTINAGAGNNAFTINSTAGSTDTYTLTTTGSGTNTINAGDDLYVVTLGAGTNNVTLGNGTNTFNSQITAGTGTNTITTGNGQHTISVGAGATTINTGSGNDAITTAGGGGTINAGAGNNTFTINSTAGSTDTYTLTATGSGNNIVTAGDDLYTVTLGAGTNSVTLGNGTDAFNTHITTGAGPSTITTGNGQHTISVGAGATTINTGSGNDAITTAGGGGTINAGAGNNTFTINSTAGSTNTYTLTTTGTGTTGITAGDDNYTITLASGANTVSIGTGTSNITATGAGTDSITTGNGTMTIAAGAGTGNTIMVGSGTTYSNAITISDGNGAGDSVTTFGGTGSRGTIAIGTGNNDVVNAGLGNFTITVGGANGVTNTLTLAAGSGDSITAGAGNNTVYLGSHATGTDTVTVGNGANTIYLGTGTNTLTGGTGTNTLNFTNLTSALTATLTSTGIGTATGTNYSNTFSGFTTIDGTNYGDTISLAATTGAMTVYDGTGNDTITLGTGVDNIHAGNGNNIITGSSILTSTGDFLYGGTGNNTYNTPNAGTTYNGTNGANLAALANNLAYSFTNTTATNPFASATGIPSTITTSYSGGVETVHLNLSTQINELNYGSTSTTNLTVNLASGTGIGGNAAGSIYTFTPTAGYSTINEVIGNNGSTTLTPSFDNTVLIGGYGGATFNDGSTLASQTVMLVGNNTATGNGTDYYNMGLATEIIVASTHNYNIINYSGASAGVVLNLDSVSHTFTSSLFTSSLTIAAYSGSNWGADANGTALGTTGANASSWTAGDYFVPVAGTATDIGQIGLPAGYDSVVYGGSSGINFYAPNEVSGSVSYFYAGSGGSTYYMYYGNAVADVLTAGGTNVFYVNTGYNMFVILNKANDTGAQATKDSAVSLTYGGTTYTGFAYGWNDVVTPSGNPLTYISGYENILGSAGNDYIVGDNNNNQINAEAGSNTIILGSGTNIVTDVQGSNSITSATGHTVGTNTLNFETVNDGYSGLLAGNSGGNNAVTEVFLNYSSSSTQSTFFGAGGDETAFYGSSALASAYEARTGNSAFSYTSVQAGIISVINGGDYASGTLNSAIAVGSASTATNASFVFDNVYSGATTIHGHAGADVFIDNNGTSAQTFDGSGDTSNLYYASASQIPTLTITGNSSYLNILRVEAWGAATPGTSGNAFGTNDPFSTTKITGVTEIDVRSGVDSVNTTTSTITLGPNSTANGLSSHPVFNLSAADIQNIVGTASTPTLILKLDSGETFVPTGTGTTGSTVISGNTTSYYTNSAHTTLIATDTHTAGNYYSDVVVFNATNNAHLQIHYGSG